MEKYRFYIAVALGLIWILTSFLPLPQMFILYLTEGISTQLNFTDHTTTNILFSICVLIFCALYYRSDRYWTVTLNAFGVAIFLTPIFAYYDNVIPQSPFFMPVMLNGIAISMILLLLNYLNRSTQNNGDLV